MCQETQEVVWWPCPGLPHVPAASSLVPSEVQGWLSSAAPASRCQWLMRGREGP